MDPSLTAPELRAPPFPGRSGIERFFDRAAPRAAGVRARADHPRGRPARARAAAEEDRQKARTAARQEQAEASEPGAIDLAVLNGGPCADGWGVMVDDAGEQRFAGTTAALAGVLPGIRVFNVRGRIDGAEREATVAIRGAAGEVGVGAVSL